MSNLAFVARTSPAAQSTHTRSTVHRSVCPGVIPVTRATGTVQQQSKRHMTGVCRAEPENKTEEPSTAPASTSQPQTATVPEQPKAPREPSAEDKEAQRTALITGVASIVFGVLYLGLVFFMDSRGEMKPPPPEAFGL